MGYLRKHGVITEKTVKKRKHGAAAETHGNYGKTEETQKYGAAPKKNRESYTIVISVSSAVRTAAELTSYTIIFIFP